MQKYNLGAIDKFYVENKSGDPANYEQAWSLEVIAWKAREKPAVSSVAKRTLSVREVWDSIPGPVKSS